MKEFQNGMKNKMEEEEKDEEEQNDYSEGFTRETAASESKPRSLEYGIEDRPPWYLSIILGIQASFFCL